MIKILSHLLSCEKFRFYKLKIYSQITALNKCKFIISNKQNILGLWGFYRRINDRARTIIGGANAM